MGIYDRDYSRAGQPGITLRGPSTVVGWLVLINVVLYLANGLLTPGNSANPNLITGVLALHVFTLTHPLYWWEFLTYGFAHAPFPTWEHIVGNMLGLWFLGRDIEQLYGRKEFLRLYLVTIVVAGVIQCLYMKLVERADPGAAVYGASGAIAGIVVLYAVHFPRRTLLLFFIIPMPAWVAGVLLIVLDSVGTLNPGADHIGHAAHLGGAAFAFLYYRSGWRFTPWTDRLFSLGWLKRRPKLRVHRPDRSADDHRDDRDDTGDEVDRILAKIHRDGVESLTAKERRALEAASHRYQQRRKE